MNQAGQAATRLTFLETAYDLGLPEDVWLGKLIDTVASAWGRPKFAFGYAYDASDTSNFKVDSQVIVRGPKEVEDLMPIALSTIKALPPEIIAGAYRSVPVGFGRPIGVIGSNLSGILKEVATTDVFAINGLDATGKGCAIGLGAERTNVSESELQLFHRLSCHLASAHRFRRRMREQRQNSALEGWEAILNIEGRMLDARGSAEGKGERTAIQHAAEAMQSVRRRGGDDEPTSAWLPRIRTRWTLVDAFESNGERYIVARENQSSSSGLEALTEREREIVVSIGLGKSRKETAYDLGVTDTTVRVLLARARTRLGVKTNQELLDLPAIRAFRGQTGP